MPLPITPTSDYGLDYGPAPLDVSAAKAAGIKLGKPLSDETIAVASGTGTPTGAVTSAQPVSAAASSMPLAANLPMLPEAGADPFDNPYFKGMGYQPQPKTAQELVSNFMGMGLPLGAALTQYQNMRAKGLVGELPGGAELESNMPGFAERVATEGVLSAAKPIWWLGSWLPGQVGQFAQEQLNKSEDASEALQPGWAKGIGDVAGYALNAEMMGPLAEAAAGQIAPRLPFLAKGLTAVDRLDSGLGMSGEAVSQLAPAVARLKKWQEGIQMGVKYGLADVSRGQAPVSSVLWPFGIEGGKYLLGGLGKLTGIGQSAARLTVKNQDALEGAYQFLAKQAGVGVADVKGQVWSTEQLLQGLRDTGAPDHVLQKVYNSGTIGELGNEWAQYVGTHAATQRWSPDELQQFVAASGGKYQDLTLKAYDEALGGLRGEAEDIKPPESPVGRFSVIDRPVARGGVDAYMHPMSQWAQTTNLLGEAMEGPGSRAVVKEFENPLDVVFKQGEHPAEALFKQSTGPLANDVAVMANRIAQAYAPDTKAYNDILYNLAGKLASDGGYKSIRFLGPSPADDIVLDLKRFDKNVPLNALGNLLQNRIRNAATTVFNGIPSYWLPIVGGAAIAGAAYNPPESKGMGLPLGELGEAISGGLGQEVGNYTGERLLRPFIEMITPTGESVRSIPGMGGPILHSDILRGIEPNWSSPSGATYGGTLYGGGEQLPVPVGSQYHMQDALSRGFVRAGRNAGASPGPFVELDANAPGAREKAAQFLITQFNPASKDEIALDIHNQGKLSSVMGLTDLNKALGYVDAGEVPPRSTMTFRDFRGVVPPLAVGVGLGSLAGQEKAHASLLPPEAVEEFLSEGLEAGFPKLVEASAPTAQVVKMLQMNMPAATHEDLVNSYEELTGDLKDGSNLTVSQLGTGPSGSFGVSHPATDPWYLATLHGSVDPDSGTWYADLAQTKQFGFGTEALKNIFGQVKGLNPQITKLGGKYAGLAGLAAALYGVYDYFAPAKADAIEIGPLEEFFAKGSPEISDFLNDAAHNKSVEDYIQQAQRQRGVSAAINSGQTFSTEGEALFANGPQSGPTDPAAKDAIGSMDIGGKLNGAPSWRPQFDMNDGPLWQLDSGQFTRSRDALITAKNSVQNQLLRLALTDILPRNGVELGDAGAMSDFFRAVDGFKMGPDGMVTQTLTDLSPGVAKAAGEYDSQVNRVGFKVAKGVDVEAHGIAAKYGMDFNDPETWQRMRWLQTNPEGTPLPDGSMPKASEVEAAKEMQGHLIFDQPETHHDLSVSYGNGVFGFQPVGQQRATLQDLLKQLQTIRGGAMTQDDQAKAAIIQKYLGDLDEIDRQNLVRRAPRLEALASNQYFQPFKAPKGVEVPAELADALRETDPAKVVESHIAGMMNKVFWDKQLYLGRKMTQMYTHGFPVDWEGGTAVVDQNGALADQVIENRNVYRGLRSVKETASTARLFSSLKRLAGGTEDVTSGQVQAGLRSAMNWQYITKLGGLRYPLIASTHPLLTAMAVGPEHLFPGYAAVMNDWEGATKEAEAQFVLPARGGFLQELSGTNGVGKANTLSRFMSWLPEKAQNFNRLVAFQTGKHWAGDMIANTGKFSPPSWLKFFDESLLDGTHSPQEVIQGAAAAFTRTTQFVFTPEGRPLGFTGGPVRQLLGQFKGFSTNYAVFMKNLLLHGKATGEWRPFINAVTSLAVIGGGTSAAALAPTALIGVNIYDLMRTELLKHGIALPQGSLLGAVGNWALAGAGVDPTSGLSQAFNAVQMGGHLDPFHLPTDPAHVPSYVLGPTLGGMLDLGVSAGKTLLGKQRGLDFGKDVATTALGPLAGTIPEAAQEAGLFGDFFSQIGYRGGMYSPTGKALANQPGPVTQLARMLNLQPGIRAQRYQQVQDIQHAMEGGQTAAANQLVDEARAAGYIIDKRELAALRGQIKSNQSKQLKANVGP